LGAGGRAFKSPRPDQIVADSKIVIRLGSIFFAFQITVAKPGPDGLCAVPKLKPLSFAWGSIGIGDARRAHRLIDKFEIRLFVNLIRAYYVTICTRHLTWSIRVIRRMDHVVHRGAAVLAIEDLPRFDGFVL
jgi:hypothetical protein